MEALATLHLPRLGRRHARIEADRRIERGSAGIDPSLEWRVRELTSCHERTRLARSLRGIVKDLSPSRLPGASPVNRVALRPHARLISELADRLDDPGRPVDPAGVVVIHRLVTDPGSPFYTGADGSAVAELLLAAREGLEPR